MHAQLTPFLQRLAQRPFQYGQTDCALVIADWWNRVHGFDPAYHLRNAYDDEDSCAEVLKREGGLPRLVARLARQVGAEKASEPKPGDFAVLRMDGRWWGAIRTPGHRWAVKCGEGLTAVRDERVTRVVAAWSV